VSAEQLVLRALGFDVVMDVPVRRLLLFFLLSFERDLPTVTAQGEGGAGAQLKPESFAQLARTCTAIVNDVVTTSVCIEHPPEELAAGILYLGASLNTSFMTIDVVERCDRTTASLCASLCPPHHTHGASHPGCSTRVTWVLSR
jgi:hypothetical protein